MKAAIFEAPGLDNLKVIDNVDEPIIGDHVFKWSGYDLQEWWTNWCNY
jgi:hypothetical protein